MSLCLDTGSDAGTVPMLLPLAVQAPHRPRSRVTSRTIRRSATATMEGLTVAQHAEEFAPPRHTHASSPSRTSRTPPLSLEIGANLGAEPAQVCLRIAEILHPVVPAPLAAIPVPGAGRRPELACGLARQLAGRPSRGFGTQVLVEWRRRCRSRFRTSSRGRSHEVRRDCWVAPRAATSSTATT
jgi:hypothetical protein